MKLIIAIIPYEKSANLITQLVSKKFQATELVSAGGVLKKSGATILVGLEDERVDEALELVRGTPGSTAFVTSVERFEKV